MTQEATINDQAVTPYVEFWNDTLAEKFERFRDILMNGLSYHSRVPLAKLDVDPGARVLDVGCGWGDTAIQLARKTGPHGFVLGLDCVETFLEHGQRCGSEQCELPGRGRRTLPV